MPEMPSFRSSINGFHRGDVIDYIKKLLDDTAALKNQLNEARAENAALKKDLAQKERQIEEIQKERQGEELLGRTMCDARRFSDTLVQEANDKAADILDNAAIAATDVSARLNDVSAQAQALKQCFNTAMTSIDRQLSKLYEKLTEFEEDVGKKKIPFAALVFANQPPVAPEKVVSADFSEKKEFIPVPEEKEEEVNTEPEPYIEAEESFSFSFEDEEDKNSSGVSSEPPRLTVKKVRRTNGKK